MSPAWKSVLTILLAATAGGVAAWIVWRLADRSLKAELSSGGDLLAQSLAQGRTQLSSQALAARNQIQAAVGTAIQQQVIPAVRTEVQRSLSSAGITPTFVTDVKKVLAVGVRVGII